MSIGFTDEPGISIPGELGIRHEDTVVVTETGCENLTKWSWTPEEPAGLPEPARRAAEWMGAFGEGMAMLAAAGSPDVHPHAASKPEDRQRWDRDMANFGADLAKLNDFFEEILGGRLDQEHARERAMEFFGVQGPWYTVGYRMAAVVEKRYGRAALLRCMEDPRMLLATWNRIAGADHTWSETVLAAVHARSAQ